MELQLCSISYKICGKRFSEIMSNKGIEDILKTEYSERFDEVRKKAIATSYYKYGPVSKNYPNGNINALLTANKCIEKYKETGNTEYLCDAANYLMFEFMYPQQSHAYFKSTTEEKDSAGIVGISHKEIEEYRRNAACESGIY